MHSGSFVTALFVNVSSVVDPDWSRESQCNGYMVEVVVGDKEKNVV